MRPRVRVKTMSSTAHLWLYFLVVFGVVILPGMDMAFVLGSALVGGRRAGLAAVAGIVTGGFCHVAMGALGIATLLAVAPAAFNVMLLAGAAYVAWIGLSLLRSGTALSAAAGTASSPGKCYRQAVATSLLNPKAYVFMLAVFPQFLRPAEGSIAAQAVALSAITAATQAGVYGGLALAAARTRSWLEARPARGARVGRAVGVVLVLAAILTGVQGWRGA